MAERYAKQFEFTNTVYLPDCPVALEKGAVLLDTKQNIHVLQLKFANIGTSGISSVRVYIEPIDNAGNPVCQELAINYEEFTAVGGSFGAKKLLPLPSNTATKFNVYVVKVVTVDGNTLSFPREQYTSNVDMRNIVAERRVESAKREEQAHKAKDLYWGAKWYRVLLTVNGAVLLLFTIWRLLPPFITQRIWDRVWSRSWDDLPWWFSESRHQLLPDIILPSLRTGWWRNADVSPFVGHLLVYTPMVLLLLFFWYVWFSAWRSIGTPRILKRTAVMAIFMPLGHLIFDTIIALWLWTSLETEWWGRVRDIMPFREFILPFSGFRDSLWWIGFFLLFAIPFVCIFINARRYDKSIKLARSLMFWLPSQEGLATSSTFSTNSSNPTIKNSNLFCTGCGEKSQQGTKFCTKCGGKISE
ncbi:MAG: zinc ribbon domain-containing protein [Defluviitaleaceae bacterium]|nr:zinc ribbon domain-containing protein [Defluviitaleaceae bacterium]